MIITSRRRLPSPHIILSPRIVAAHFRRRLILRLRLFFVIFIIFRRRSGFVSFY